LAKLPENKQMALFSATMPSRIRQIANNYLNNPASVEIRMETATVKSIEQRFLFASYPQKPDALSRILAVEDYQGVIIFTRTKTSTEEVAEYLQQQGLKASAIHGDLTQNLRERIIMQFRQGTIDILVATDVAARGLDVERVTHVINYDIPQDCETYVHRIGRTGRAGRSGVTILFVTPRESRMISVIERHTRQRIEKIQIPNEATIEAVRQQALMQNIQTRLQHDNLPAYKRIVDDFLKIHPEVDPANVAAVLALLLHQDKPWHRETTPAQTLNGKESRQRPTVSYKDNGRKYDRRDHPSSALFRIDVGRIHGVKPGNIVGAIANEAGLESRLITGLKINDDHSTVRLPKDISRESFQNINKAWVCGRQLKLTLLQERA
jgi:ATP-dependent RNA helicase DeaD